MSEIKPAVVKAIEEIRSTFPDQQVECYADGSGGGFVVVRSLPLIPPYAQAETWVGFQITFPYPYADVYPHFVRPDLSRTDGKALGDGFSSPAQFRGQPAIQISRRSNKLNPATDTACLKLLKILQWMKTRP